MAKQLLGKEVVAALNERIIAKSRSIKSKRCYTDTWNCTCRRK